MATWLFRIGLALGFVIAAVLGSWGWTWFVPPALLEVGPETTVITRPLRADSTIAYFWWPSGVERSADGLPCAP